MPGPVKNRPTGGVTNFPTKDDASKRVDKGEAVKKANTPQPKEVDLKPKGQTAPTLVVLSPPSVAKKDATGMMASKPVDQHPPPVSIRTNDHNIVDPYAAAHTVQANYGPAQPQPAPPRQPQMVHPDVPMPAISPAGVAGAPMGLSVQLAQDIIRKLRASGRIK